MHEASVASRSERKLVRERPTLWGGIREVAAMCAVEAKANEFSAKATVDAVEAELLRRFEPLLDAAKELLDVMETCHICEGALLLEESPIHCENCSSYCDNHAEPECKPIYVLHDALRRKLKELSHEQSG